MQLAVGAGVRVLGTARAGQLDAVRALGAEAIDREREDVPARVRELAPAGVDAVFDHVGGAGLAGSWSVLRRGGVLVSYGSAATKDVVGRSRWPVLALFARLALWNALPNGRRATFFNLWGGSRRRDRFRAQLAEDLGGVLDAVRRGDVLDAVRRGDVVPQLAATFPLADAVTAMRFAGAGGNVGKVVLRPQELPIAGEPHDRRAGAARPRRHGA